MNNALYSIKKLEFGCDDYETINLIVDKINELIYVINQSSGIIKEVVNTKCAGNIKYGGIIEKAE